MAKQTKFPSELLLKPAKERIEYFKEYVVAHKKITEVFEELLDAIHSFPPGSLIIVCGPTGVGKTTLCVNFIEEILKVFELDMENDKSFMPIAAVEVPVIGGGYFSWIDYYKRGLGAMNDPMIGMKTWNNLSDRVGRPLVNGSKNRTDLRLEFENALINRKTKFFLSDEGQHFLKIPGGSRLLDQLDALKSLANITRTTHILIGTYELLLTSKLNAQLIRRIKIIHFPRYRFNDPGDLQVFKGVIENFQNHLPFPVQPDLAILTDFLYERSMGCVGILKDWLYKSLKLALKEEKKTITTTILKSTALTAVQSTQLAREIWEGEERARDMDDLKMVRTYLQMDEKPSAQPIKKVKSKNSRPGNRKPTRDSVGMGNETKQ